MMMGELASLADCIAALIELLPTTLTAGSAHGTDLQYSKIS